MTKYSLTIATDNVVELDALLHPAKAGTATPAPAGTDEMIEELKRRLAEDGRTLVVRAARNSKTKDYDDGSSTDEAEDETAAEDENAGDQAEAEDETPEQTEAADGDDALDYDTALEAVTAAVTGGGDPTLAATVRKSMGVFMKNNPSVKKLSDIKTDAAKAAFVEHVEKDLPDLFSDVPF